MRTLITPELIADLARWNRANRRARIEYRRHPFAKAAHGFNCAGYGCAQGEVFVAKRRVYMREYARVQRAAS